MCPLYVAGLISPGERKSIAPMAERLGLSAHGQLHRFVSAGTWNAAPLLEEMAPDADALLRAADAVLLVDDSPPQERLGLGPCGARNASVLARQANRQTLVSLTLTQG
jgi:SRSO17 transposase